MKENNKELPIKEAIEITAKTALSAIPIGGALITNVWDAVKSNCAQNRQKEWQLMVEERLSHVEIALEEIGNDEKFTSAIIFATQSAIKTGEKEKREYLANALLHSIRCKMDESKMMMFLSMLDEYTVLHLKLLDYFQNPKRFTENNQYYAGSPFSCLFDVYPEMKEDEELVRKAINDLKADGLMSSDSSSLDAMMTSNGMLASRTTKMGNEFIEFIRE